MIDGFKEHYQNAGVDLVIGIEARGFIFASALAYALGAGFVPVRKPKKLPGEMCQRHYSTSSTAPTAWRCTRARSPAGIAC